MPESATIESALSLIKEDPSKILGLKFGTHEVKPGDILPRAEAMTAPKLSFDAPPGTYMVVNLDLDAPFPSFPFLSPILHWIQPGLQPQAADNGPANLAANDTPWIADYAGPGPPPGSAVHRYVFLLYEQPASFDVKEWAPAEGSRVGVFGRMRYDLGAFEKKAGLGPVVAANYFCSN